MTTATMQLTSRVFWIAKDKGYENHYEDAYAVECTRAVAAIADGVGSGFASGRWARLLTTKLMTVAPDLEKPGGLSDWLSGPRGEWERQLGELKLDYFQRQKLRESGGAYTTLLWVECHPAPSSPPENASAIGWSWSCHAAGDCGLFHERDGKILRVFPFENPDDLAADPQALASKDHGKDRSLEFKTVEGLLEPGDMLVLCTDALLGWALHALQDGRPLTWKDYWDMPDETWREEIEALRTDDVIRVDDTTLILLRLEATSASPEPVPASDTQPDLFADDALCQAAEEEAVLQPTSAARDACVTAAADTTEAEQPAVIPYESIEQTMCTASDASTEHPAPPASDNQEDPLP